MSGQHTFAVGDTFNETDDDRNQIVVEIFTQKEPPSVLCRHMKDEEDEDSEPTEEEYALMYVEDCVNSRKQFQKEGFADMDVYGIHKLTKSN